MLPASVAEEISREVTKLGCAKQHHIYSGGGKKILSTQLYLISPKTPLIPTEINKKQNFLMPLGTAYVWCPLWAITADFLKKSRETSLPYTHTNYRQACAKCSHAGIVLTQWSKNRFFARLVAPINVKCGTGERSAPRATFHVYRGRNVGIQPQNCQNWGKFIQKIAIFRDFWGCTPTF